MDVSVATAAAHIAQVLREGSQPQRAVPPVRPRPQPRRGAAGRPRCARWLGALPRAFHFISAQGSGPGPRPLPDCWTRTRVRPAGALLGRSAVPRVPRSWQPQSHAVLTSCVPPPLVPIEATSQAHVRHACTQPRSRPCFTHRELRHKEAPQLPNSASEREPAPGPVVGMAGAGGGGQLSSGCTWPTSARGFGVGGQPRVAPGDSPWLRRPPAGIWVARETTPRLTGRDLSPGAPPAPPRARPRPCGLGRANSSVPKDRGTLLGGRAARRVGSSQDRRDDTGAAEVHPT